jgi:hypothetical protein
MESSLSDTCIIKNVQTDLENMKKEFDKLIVPFLNDHKEKFTEKCFDFELYKEIAGFIMAYSFRDPNEDVYIV